MTDIDNFIISGGLTGKTQVIMSVIWFFLYLCTCMCARIELHTKINL